MLNSDEEYDSRCIQIIFAATSDYICTESFKSKVKNMDRLRDALLKKPSTEFDTEKWLSETLKDSLILCAPSVMKVSFIDYRLEQEE